jgi:integrase
MLPAGCKLTSYTSRHSWATAAMNHNVPISVISTDIGHTSEQATQIYLTMLENLVIDDANKRLIRLLLE